MAENGSKNICINSNHMAVKQPRQKPLTIFAGIRRPFFGPHMRAREPEP